MQDFDDIDFFSSANSNQLQPQQTQPDPVIDNTQDDDDFFNEKRSDSNTLLPFALDAGGNKSAEDAIRDKQFEDKHGIKVSEIAQLDPARAEVCKMLGTTPEDFSKTYPRLANAYSNPYILSLAKEDTQSLMKIENALKLFAETTKQSVEGVAENKEELDEEATTGWDVGEIRQVGPNVVSATVQQGASQLVGGLLGAAVSAVEAVDGDANTLKSFKASVDSWGTDFSTMNKEWNWLEKNLAGGASSGVMMSITYGAGFLVAAGLMAASIPVATAMTLMGNLSLGLMAISAYGQAYDEGRKKGLTVGEAAGHGAWQGGWEFITEKMNIKAVKDLYFANKPMLRDIANFMKKEIGTEELNSFMQGIEEAFVMPDKTVGEFLQPANLLNMVAETAIQTVVGAGVQTGTARGLHAIATSDTLQLGGAVIELAKTQENVNLLRSMADYAQNSALAQRAPDQLAQVVSEVTKQDTPWAYISHEALTPEVRDKIRAVVPELDAAITKAVAQQDDLAMPIDAMAELVSDESIVETLNEHVKFDQNGRTVHEAKQNLAVITEQAKAEVERLISEQKKEADGTSETQQIIDDLAPRLRDTGTIIGQSAKDQAVLWGKFFTRLSGQFQKAGKNVSAMDLYKKYGSKITGPDTEMVRMDTFNRMNKATRGLTSVLSEFDKKVTEKGSKWGQVQWLKDRVQEAVKSLPEGNAMRSQLEGIKSRNAEEYRAKVEAILKSAQHDIEANSMKQQMSTVVSESAGQKERTKFTTEYLTLDGIRKNAPEYIKKMLAKLIPVNGIGPMIAKGNTEEEQLRIAIDSMKDNLRWLWNLMPEELRDRAKKWYVGGRKFVEKLSHDYGISDMQSAAVIAVFSPQRDWFSNLTLAQRLCDVFYGTARNFVPDKAMIAKAKSYIDKKKGIVAEYKRALKDPGLNKEKETYKEYIEKEKVLEKKKQGFDKRISEEKDKAKRIKLREKKVATKKALEAEIKVLKAECSQYRRKLSSYERGSRELEEQLAAFNKIKSGKTFQQLIDEKDDFAAGMAFRAYNDAYNPNAFNVMTPEGLSGESVKSSDGKETTSGFPGFDVIAKAVSVLRDGSASNVYEKLGSMHKVRSFYNNLYDPSNPNAATIDTHATAAALLLPLAASDVEVNDNFGTISTAIGYNGVYPIYNEAYRELAQELSKELGVKILPREVQSVTWEVARVFFTSEYKGKTDSEGNKTNVIFVRDTWDRVTNGTITANEAREKIKEHALAQSGGEMHYAWENIVPPENMDTVIAGDTYDRSGITIDNRGDGQYRTRVTIDVRDKEEAVFLRDMIDEISPVIAEQNKTMISEAKISIDETGWTVSVDIDDVEKAPVIAKQLSEEFGAAKTTISSIYEFDGSEKTLTKSVILPLGLSNDKVEEIVSVIHSKTLGKVSVNGTEVVIESGDDSVVKDALDAVDSGIDLEVFSSELYKATIESKQTEIENGEVVQESRGIRGGDRKAYRTYLDNNRTPKDFRRAGFGDADSRREASRGRRRAVLWVRQKGSGVLGHGDVGSRQIGGRRLSITGVYSADELMAKTYQLNGMDTPDLFELEQGTDASAEAFAAAITKAKESNPHGSSVYVYPTEEYKGMRLFLTEDGNAGVAVKQNGDIVSVFNNKAGKHVVHMLIETAISVGGNHMDCYDTVLPALYEMHGAKVVSRQTFNPAFAEGWNEEPYRAFNNGRPDVTYMVVDRENFNYYSPYEGERIEDYDDAVSEQMGEVQRLYGKPEDSFAQRVANILPQAVRDAMKRLGYHASPYTFDKFDLEKVGTGVAGSSRAWGIHFGLNRNAVEPYKKRFDSRQAGDVFKERFLEEFEQKKQKNKSLTTADRLTRRQILSLLNSFMSGDDMTVSQSIKWIDNLKAGKYGEEREFIEEDFLEQYGKPISEATKEEVADFIDGRITDAMDAGNVAFSNKIEEKITRNLLKGGFSEKAFDVGVSNARIYETEIPNDDVLLMAQGSYESQSESVKKAIDELAEEYGIEKERGKYIYDSLADKLGSQKAASLKLLEKGVKGIFIKDQYSAPMFIIWDENAMNIVNRDAMKQIAYTGSPYLFDKFSLDHIGEGEGAQTHGWGLYFSLAQRIAENYRKMYSSPIDEDIYFIDGEQVNLSELDESENSRGPSIAIRYLVEYGNYDDAKKAIEETDDFEDIEREEGIEYLDVYKDSEIKISRAVANGTVYTVEIPDDNVLLREDVTYSKQPYYVRKALKKLSEEFQLPGETTTTDVLLDEKTRSLVISFVKAAEKIGASEFVSDILNAVRPRVYALSKEEDEAIKKRALARNIDKISTLRIDVVKNKEALKEFNERFTELCAYAVKGTDTKKNTKSFFDLYVKGKVGRDIYRNLKQAINDRKTRSDRQASELLLKYGIKGIRYEGRQDGPCAVIWDENAIKILDFFEKNPEKLAEAKGEANVGAERSSIAGWWSKSSNTLGLTKDTNITTFAHESGHMFLNIYFEIARDADAPQSIKKDVAVLMDWFGLKDLQQFFDLEAKGADYVREYHEKFARGFEAYLREGRAPSRDLEGIFYKFKRWITDWYKDKKDKEVIDNAKSDLTADVRAVMARMLASEEEIDRENKIASFANLWVERKNFPGTDEQYLDYIKLVKDSDLEARARLTAAYMEELEFMRERKEELMSELAKKYNDEFNEAYEDAKERLLTNPLYKALERITKGEDAVSLKISKAEVSTLPQNTVERLNALGVLSEDGYPLEAVSKELGFESDPVGFINGLSKLQPLDAKASEMAEAQMTEDNEDIMSKEGRDAVATAAVMNELAMKRAEKEYAIIHATKKTPELVAAAQLDAENTFGDVKIGNVQTGRYKRKATKASQNAVAMAAKGDVQGTADAKQAEVFAMAKAKKAADIIKRKENLIKKVLRIKRKAKKLAERRALDSQFLDQVLSLMSHYTTKRNGRIISLGTENPSRRTFAKFKEDWTEKGVPLDAIDETLFSGTRSLEDMTVDEFETLADAVDILITQGRRMSEISKENYKVNLQNTVDECVIEIESASDEKPPRVSMKKPIEKFMTEMLLSHRKFSSLIYELCGFKYGKLAEVTLTRLNNAASREATMTQDFGKKYWELVKNLKNLDEKAVVHQIQNPNGSVRSEMLTKRERIAIALNAGNEGNRQRLEADGFDAMTIFNVFSTLSEEEIQFVQNVWDLIDQFWRPLADLELRTNGLEPKKVLPVPFSVTSKNQVHINLKGGYYPIKYDRSKNSESVKQEIQDYAKSLFRGAVTSSATKQGHAKTREEKTDLHLLLDPDVIGIHAQQVIHDLCFREALQDINKLFKNETLKKAIESRKGAEWMSELTNALTDIAADGASGVLIHDGVSKALGYFRGTLSASVMGLSVTTTLLQPLGLLQSAARLGPKAVLSGTLHAMKDRKSCYEMSEMMRNRRMTMNVEIREVGRALSRTSNPKLGKAWTDFKKVIFWPMMAMQQVVDVPTWYGAYDMARSEGKSEKDAIAFADQTVLDTQGSGDIKDMSRVHKNHPMLTMFYSYFSATYQLVAESGKKNAAKGALGATLFTRDVLMLLAIPNLVTALFFGYMRGSEPPDDEGEWLKFALKEFGGSVLNMFVIAREAVPVYEALIQALGDGGSAPTYNGPAIARVIPDMTRLVMAMSGDKDSFDKTMAVLPFIGDVTGLPTTQLVRSLKGAKAYIEGETDMPTAVLFGKPTKEY